MENVKLDRSKAFAAALVGITIGLLAAATILHSHTLHVWAHVACVASAVAWLRHFFIEHAKRVEEIHEGTPKKHIDALERAFSLGMAAQRAAQQSPPNVHQLNGTTH